MEYQEQTYDDYVEDYHDHNQPTEYPYTYVTNGVTSVYYAPGPLESFKRVKERPYHFFSLFFFPCYAV